MSPTDKGKNVQMRKYENVQMCKYENMQMCKYANLENWKRKKEKLGYLYFRVV